MPKSFGFQLTMLEEDVLLLRRTPLFDSKLSFKFNFFQGFLRILSPERDPCVKSLTSVVWGKRYSPSNFDP